SRGHDPLPSVPVRSAHERTDRDRTRDLRTRDPRARVLATTTERAVAFAGAAIRRSRARLRAGVLLRLRGDQQLRDPCSRADHALAFHARSALGPAPGNDHAPEEVGDGRAPRPPARPAPRVTAKPPMASPDAIDETFVARRAGTAHTVEVDGEAVLLNDGRLHLLNATGTLVWACFDGEGTIAEIAADISDGLGVPYETVLDDTLAVPRDLGTERL